MMRFYIGAGVVMAVIAAVILLRHDAASDAVEQIKRDANQSRIEHLEGAKNAEKEINDMGDNDILGELWRVLRQDRGPGD